MSEIFLQPFEPEEFDEYLLYNRNNAYSMDIEITHGGTYHTIRRATKCFEKHIINPFA